MHELSLTCDHFFFQDDPSFTPSDSKNIKKEDEEGGLGEEVDGIISYEL